MVDTKEEILYQLRAGEDGRAEFKDLHICESSVVSPGTEEMAGELVAFANADGGAVFVGVRDDGVVQGIPEDPCPSSAFSNSQSPDSPAESSAIQAPTRAAGVADGRIGEIPFDAADFVSFLEPAIVGPHDHDTGSNPSRGVTFPLSWACAFPSVRTELRRIRTGAPDAWRAAPWSVPSPTRSDAGFTRRAA